MNRMGRIILEKAVIRKLIETSPNITQLKGLFLCSYETVNNACSETDESSSKASFF
jgi:hypothetical protein